MLYFLVWLVIAIPPFIMAANAWVDELEEPEKVQWTIVWGTTNCSGINPATGAPVPMGSAVDINGDPVPGGTFCG